MKLVLLFFCGIFALILILLVLIIFSSIRLNVEKLHISNIKNNIRKEKLERQARIYIEFFLLGFIKIAKVRITKKLIQKLNEKADVKDLKKDMKAIKNIPILEILKKLKIKSKKIYLDLNFGTESMMFTVYAVAAISSFLGILFSILEPKEMYFRVNPMYNFGNSINFNLNCIINVKVVNIIYVIYILLKKRRNGDERTSNRRAYDYSYE